MTDPQFDLATRLEEITDDVDELTHLETREAIKQLLRDFSKYVTPEDFTLKTTCRECAAEQKTTILISELVEANTRKVLGDE